jgi:chemotaxis protein histidine kinase CheA/ActR/RegA family two-component response regulator
VTVRNDPSLLELFFEEARERLDRVMELVDKLDTDREAIVGLRRELHALKGASRMMGLNEISELCHRAEDLAEADAGTDHDDLAICCKSISNRVEGLADSRVDAVEGTVRTEGSTGRGRRRFPGDEDLRVPARVIDGLADRGARLRVIAVGAEGLADRVFRLATLAERGVGDRAPEQVLATLATSLRQVGLDLEGGQRIFRRLTDRQLDALLHLQVQPIRPFVHSLADHARELADALGKRVEVTTQAGDVQLDRRIANALREAFLHLMRNAVDHGVETPSVRRRSGKPEIADVRLEASTTGNRVRLVVRDDGAGIDAGAILDAAVNRGFVDAEHAAGLADAEALQLLLLPGFSTRDEATEVSGRGVGLDAVATAVHGVGGDVRLESGVGSGTTVIVEVPVARRGDRVLVLRAGEHQLALPAAPIQAFRRIPPGSVEDKNGRRTVLLRGQSIAPCFLSDLVGGATSGSMVLVETIVAGVVVGIVADEVVGEEEVIIRPIPASAGAPTEVEGMTLLASGRPVAVLSLQRLGLMSGWDVARRAAVTHRAHPVTVLLVDDSDVTREMFRRLLEDAGLLVSSVGSAEDALHVLASREIDCVITDIEMPGLDGIGLTRAIRDDADFADLPIVVVSTLDRPSDRLAGLEAGADAYLTKQGLDARELVALVYRVAGNG